MEAGDISNNVGQRFVVVFEGLIGVLPDVTAQRKRDLYLKAHAWKRAARQWGLDSMTQKRMWDLGVRRSANVDIITYLDEREAEPIKERLDEVSYPFGNFTSTSLEEFVHGQLLNPGIAGVYDANPRHLLVYGRKGLGAAWM